MVHNLEALSLGLASLIPRGLTKNIYLVFFKLCEGILFIDSRGWKKGQISRGDVVVKGLRTTDL